MIPILTQDIKSYKSYRQKIESSFYSSEVVIKISLRDVEIRLFTNRGCIMFSCPRGCNQHQQL